MISVISQRFIKHTLKVIVKISDRLLHQEKDVYYFAYGANMDEERFRKASIPYIKVGAGSIDNHKLEFTMPCEYRLKGFASIEPTLQAQVWGVLYKITPEVSFLLDVMEWVPYGAYKRKTVTFVAGNGETIICYTYVACHPRKGLFPPKKYLENLIKISEHHEFPNKYIRQLRAFHSKELFELDHEFNLLRQGKKRFAYQKLRPFYIFHDRIREKVVNKLK